MNKRMVGILIFGLILMNSCQDDDRQAAKDCDREVIVDNALFRDAPSDALNIISAGIVDDSLQIEFAASGCDGDSWKIKLIDAEMIMESMPPQRKLRISLKNEEACLAVVRRKISVDLTPIRIEGYRQLLINLSNWDDQLLYKY